MERKISGGIMPDFGSDPEFASAAFKRWWNETNEEEEQARKQEAEEAAREAALEAVYDEIEATFLPHLHEEAEAVNSGSRITPADKKIFEQFKDYCKRFSPPLPALPAHPAAVAAFLTSELNRGTSHFRKRLNAISRFHRSLGLPDPCSDVLILALVRLQSSTKKG